MIIFILFILIECASTESKKTKVLNLTSFEITVPKNWKEIKMKGIDSKIGAIKLNNQEKVFYDYGLYSNKLTDLEPNNYVEYDKIDGKRAKIITGNSTGIYFDSIKFDEEDSMNIKLQFSANNLSKQNEEKLIQAFKTIKFKEK